MQSSKWRENDILRPQLFSDMGRHQGLEVIFINMKFTNQGYNKLEWAELNQAEAVRLHVYAKVRFQV